MDRKILIVDDEKNIVDIIAFNLKKEGYTVITAADGEEGVQKAMEENPDLILLDIMMPKLDGLQVLRALRDRGISTPVLLLTAKSQVADRIAGLDSGADDYLPKPFHPGEFTARVRALTRRGTEYTPDLLSAGNITLDRTTFELRRGPSSIRLGSKEFQMLELLMCHIGCPISTERFMERIWGYDSEAEINVVWAYISYLRRKLESLGANVRIVARRGQGYLLEEIS